MKGLIIHSNWLDLILSGEKTWELRSRATSIRGQIGLIRKGTGQVCAVAEITDVGSELSELELIDSFQNHRVPPSYWAPYDQFKWRYPWKLQRVRTLSQPVSYHHRNGAVIWVELNPECVADIQDELSEFSPTTALVEQAQQSDITVTIQTKATETAQFQELRNSKAPIPLTESEISTPTTIRANVATIGVDTRTITLTQGNINNGHFYLRDIKDWLPADVIGGSNQASRAPRTMTINWGGGAPAVSDVSGDKMIFRSRAWVRAFFERFALAAGDEIHINKTSEYVINISVASTKPVI